MPFPNPTVPLLLAAAAALASARAQDAQASASGSDVVDFARDVRPIFAAQCYRCHGPERQKGDLRLDSRAMVLEREDPVVVPGDSEGSLLFELITLADELERMPADGDPLNAAEIATIRAWIDQGAEWPASADVQAARHWAYVAPVRPAPPPVSDEGWPRTPLDRFVLARLDAEGLAPAPDAERPTLMRRLSLDLLGLPPTPAEVDAFVADERPDAYARLVERLLSSPHYGEKQARLWLDLARYADTHGYEKDASRTMWRYRDWVIDAFNRDLPFDEFTVEQLAGDLLPDATLDQRIATGFHRNTMLNQEGGSDPEEFRVDAVVDRVNTTASVWLGATLACAQCHDHKYDPFSQEEYYRLFAFFNNTEDDGNAVAPVVRAPTDEQRERLTELDARLAQSMTEVEGANDELDAEQARWERELRASSPPPTPWRTLTVADAESQAGATLSLLDDGSVLAGGTNPAKDVYTVALRPGATTIRALRLEALRHESLPRFGAGRAGDSNFVLSGLEVELGDGAGVRSIELRAAEADFEQAGFLALGALDADPNTGWAVAGNYESGSREAVFVPATPLSTSPEAELRVRLRFESSYAGYGIGRFRLSVTDDERLPGELALPAMSAWHHVGPFPAASGTEAFDTVFPPEAERLRDGPFTPEYGAGLAWEERADWEDGKAHGLAGEIGATYLFRTLECDEEGSITVHLGSDDSFKLWLDGELQRENAATRGVGPDQDRVVVNLNAGRNRLLLKVVNHGGAHGFWFAASPRRGGALTPRLARVLFTPDAERSTLERAALRDHYRRTVSEGGRALVAALNGLSSELTALEAQVPEALVLAERRARRETHVHVRGSFLSKGKRVEPDVPRALGRLPNQHFHDRLDLAQWLVADDNPLTARVTANRFFEQLFGTGLVATSDDFGTRGEPPSHPALLDWLATELVRRDWSVKDFTRLLVTSRAYRQASRASAALVARDPANRLLARGPRFRVGVETVRDNALSVAGLLSPKVGGPSVFPPQPEGTWAMTYSGERWTTATDEDRWRRGLYTFWRRTAPYPTFTMFDAPSREVACTRRMRSNTPLQALALLNDPAFVEAAAGLARRILGEAGPSADERAEYGFRLCVARAPRPDEREVLTQLYERERASFSAHVESARKVAAVSPLLPTTDLDPVELASWTVVANVLLNLDETVTKN